jgi:hypothetical protein
MLVGYMSVTVSAKKCRLCLSEPERGDLEINLTISVDRYVFQNELILHTLIFQRILHTVLYTSQVYR